MSKLIPEYSPRFSKKETESSCGWEVGKTLNGDCTEMITAATFFNSANQKQAFC